MDYPTTHKKALDLLARREHTELELRRKLKRYEVEADIIEQVIEKLLCDKLLSDERFTEAYVNYRRKRGYGPTRIQQELQEKGVAELIIEGYIDLSDERWVVDAEAVREKKFGAAFPEDFPGKAKQMKFLQYRGFSQKQIQSLFD